MARFALIVALVLPLSACDKPVPEETPKHPYAGFPTGSFARYRVVTDLGTVQIESENRVEILDISREKAIVERTSRMPNREPEKTKLDVYFVDLPKHAGVKAQGEQEITVPGGTFTCRWVETETEEDGKKTVTRTWTSETVPSHVIRVEKTTPKAKTVTELIEFKVADPKPPGAG